MQSWSVSAATEQEIRHRLNLVGIYTEGVEQKPGSETWGRD